jgi:signal transduction histidine kinase
MSSEAYESFALPELKRTVLLIHDTEARLKAETVVMTSFTVIRVRSARDAVSNLIKTSPDVVLCDETLLTEELCEALESQGDSPRMSRTLLCVLTRSARPTQEQVQRWPSAVMDCIPHSADPVLLEWKIHRLIQLGEEARQLEEQLAEAVDKARRLESLALMVAHDLKSPVVAMAGLLRRLTEKKTNRLTTSAQYDSLLRQALSVAEFCEGFLNNLNGLIHKEKTSGPLEPLMLPEILNDVLSQYKEAAQEKNIRIRTYARDNVSPVNGDRDRIRQVLDNLLANAFRYMGSRDYPAVSVTIGDQGDHVVVHISDNGTGIPPECQNKVFDQYYRVPDINDTEGSGLGLFLVKQIIESHKGKVWLESEPGRGSTFSFMLPKID